MAETVATLFGVFLVGMGLLVRIDKMERRINGEIKESTKRNILLDRGCPLLRENQRNSQKEA